MIRKTAVMMSARGEEQGGGDSAGLRVGLLRYYGSRSRVAGSSPLMASRTGTGWNVRMRGQQVTQCRKHRKVEAGRICRLQWRGKEARFVLKELP